MSRVWFVTGCSSGFGRLLCEELLPLGHKVVATARNVETISDLEGDNVLALPLDVTQPSQIASAVAAAEARFGQIDVLVNNAGYGVIGALEEVSDGELRTMFDVNVFGAVDVMKAVLPGMRKRRSGTILNLSSIAGLTTFPGSCTYSATKHALEALSEGAAAELAPLGIRVILIEPGPFRTKFAGSSIVIAKERMPDYEETAGKRREGIKEFDGNQKGDPVLAVRAMIQVALETDPPMRLLLGGSAYDAAYGKLDRLRAEFTTWEWLGKPTDFPE